MRGRYGIPAYRKRSIDLPQGKSRLPPPLEASWRRTAIRKGKQHGQVSGSRCLGLGRKTAHGGKRQAVGSKECRSRKVCGERLNRSRYFAPFWMRCNLTQSGKRAMLAPQESCDAIVRILGRNSKETSIASPRQ